MMSSSGLKNRFDQLALGVTDPSEVSRKKVKTSTKNSKVKRKVQEPRDSTVSGHFENEATIHPSSSQPEASTNVDAKIIRPISIQNPNAVGDAVKSTGFREAKNTRRPVKDFSQPSHTSDKKALTNIKSQTRVRFDKRYGSDDQDPQTEDFVPQKPLVDLDDELAVPVKSDVSHGRYIDKKHRNKEREIELVQNTRGRLFDRHSGTVTGSVAYNKRENRGPGSVLIRENNYIADKMELPGSVENMTAEEIDTLNMDELQNLQPAHPTITFDEFRTIQENQKVATLSYDLNTHNVSTESQPDKKPEDQAKQVSGQRGRGNRGKGRGSRHLQESIFTSGDRQGDSSFKPRFSRGSSYQQPASKPRVEKEVKIDLEKDFPILKA